MDEDLESKILHLVEKGKLTSEEAKELLAKTKREHKTYETRHKRSKETHWIRNLFLTSLFLIAGFLIYYGFRYDAEMRRQQQIKQIHNNELKQEEKKEQYYSREEHVNKEKQIDQVDTKYTTTDYYSVGEWANGGDLEFLVTSWNVRNERIHNYMGWNLYINMKIKNVSNEKINFYPRNILFNLSDEGESGGKELSGESFTLFPGAEIKRTYSTNVTNCGGLYMRLIIPKIKASGGGYRQEIGRSYINLGELPRGLELRQLR